MTNSCVAGRSFACSRSGLLVLLLTITALAVTDRAFAEPNQSRASSVEFDIPAQFVPAALSEFARQARVQLFFISDGFESIQANAVVGTYSAQEALDLLLAGTGLAADYSAESGVKVRPVRGSMKALTLGSQLFAAGAETIDGQEAAAQDGSKSQRIRQNAASNLGRAENGLEQIVVTGTSIRGIIPESTPLQIYDAVDIRNTGALTVEQFISTLTQNSNTLTEIGTGASSRETNTMSNSSVDLRGLGVGTTLVLLNGRRMAPSSNGRAADLSFIPLGSVERIEVLTDGASAIYGADAIGGVVNFVLKDQQDGAETVLTYGGANGGSEVLRIDQSFGFDWSDGNALIALSYMDQNDLDAADRDFARAASALTLVPADTRNNALVTASQLLPANVTISGDLLYSKREPRTVLTQSFAERVLENSVDHEQTVLNLELARPISEELNAALLLTYAEASADRQSIRTAFDTGTSGSHFRVEDTRTWDVTAKIDGEFAAIPSGNVMYALGIGYTEDEYNKFVDATGVGGRAIGTALNRNTQYAFAELLIPIVAADQDINGVQRLELTLAARYTNYSDFGDNTSPKIGILWSPKETLTIRGTFGESFKAPFLTQLDPNVGTFLLFRPAALGFPDIWTPDDSATVLMARGPGNPTLGPEKAQTYTLGFDFDLSDLMISTTYFKIEYTDRIAEPDPSGGFIVFGSPLDFPEFFDPRPTLEQVTQVLTSSIPSNLTEIDISDPAAVHAATTVLFDNRIQNLSITEMDGFDISIDYSTGILTGELGLGICASKIFNFEERATRSTAPISRVDTVLFPADLKVRGYIGFQKDRWNVRVNLNYVDEYANPFDAENPTVGDWTTLDFLLSYQFPTDGIGFFDGLRLGLAMQNLFDEDPPLVTVGTTLNTSILEPIGFDPANANPIGRFINLQISKGW